jgi:hypothetical protein
MARGWESKAVESQQESAREVGKSAGPPLTPEEQSHLARRRSLELAMASTQAEMRAACRSAHKDMLHLKLEAIRAELLALDAGPD